MYFASNVRNISHSLPVLFTKTFTTTAGRIGVRQEITHLAKEQVIWGGGFEGEGGFQMKWSLESGRQEGLAGPV